MTDKNLLVSADQDTAVALAHQEQHNQLMVLAMGEHGGIEKMQQLMTLQSDWEDKQALKSFNLAMSNFQAMLPVIEKKGIVDYGQGTKRTYYTYAKIEDIAKEIQPALKATGLSYRFKQTQANGAITVECIVTHRDGHSDSTEMTSTIDSSGGKDALKGLASTNTYLRRYTMTGILGVVVGGEDDDASAPGESPASEAPTEQLNCYPDDQFKANLPKWEKKIKSGAHTVDSLHSFLTGKKIILSEAQYLQLQQVGQ